MNYMIKDHFSLQLNCTCLARIGWPLAWKYIYQNNFIWEILGYEFSPLVLVMKSRTFLRLGKLLPLSCNPSSGYGLQYIWIEVLHGAYDRNGIFGSSLKKSH